MSLRSYLQAFYHAVDKISDYGFPESIDFRQEIRASSDQQVSVFTCSGKKNKSHAKALRRKEQKKQRATNGFA
jgi:hypothetical protein